MLNVGLFPSGHVSLLVASTQLCLLDYTLQAQHREKHMLLLFGSAAPKHSHQQKRTLQLFFFQLIESSKYAVVGSENERRVIAKTKHL